MKKKVMLQVQSLLAACALLIGLVSVSHARDLPDFTVLAEQNSPAVVNISTSQKSGVKRHMPKGFSMPEVPEGSPFNDLFKHFFGEGMEDFAERESQSLGSGFVISSDGYILTNYHVVADADEIQVRFSDRRFYDAKVIGSDKGSDVALIKIEATELPTVKIGKSSDLKVGEWVLAIGSPFGFDHTVTAGIVSAKGRSLPSENYVPFIQTDVAINPGNSGGPLFNLDGQVVGVNSQIYSRTGGFMGLSFAIPIDVAMDVVEQIKTKGRVSRGWLGVLIQDVTRDLAETFKMPQPMGALVAQVLPGSPAASSGLEVGDVILEFNGSPVPTSSALPPLVGVSAVGEAAKVTVLRRGETRVIDVMIGELPEDDQLASSATVPEPAKANRIGLVAEDLAAEDREQMGLGAAGVFVSNVAKGAAERAGIRAGDVVLMFDNNEVTSADQFREIIDGVESGRSVAALVQRGDGRMFFAVRIPKDRDAE